MTPLEVVVKGSEKIVGYACAKCGAFSSPLIYVATRELAEKAAYECAESCCEPPKCSVCGGLAMKWSTICDACRTENLDAKDLAAFADAPKVQASEWAEPVFADGDFYMTVEEAIEHYADRDKCPPTFMWGAVKQHPLRVDADEFLRECLDRQEYHEDAFDSFDDVEGLQSFLDGWFAKQSVDSWVEGGTAVVIDEALLAGGAS